MITTDASVYDVTLSFGSASANNTIFSNMIESHVRSRQLYTVNALYGGDNGLTGGRGRVPVQDVAW